MQEILMMQLSVWTGQMFFLMQACSSGFFFIAFVLVRMQQRQCVGKP